MCTSFNVVRNGVHHTKGRDDTIEGQTPAANYFNGFKCPEVVMSLCIAFSAGWPGSDGLREKE